MKPQALPKNSEPAFELAIRIRHPSMDPAELTRELGLEPTHTFRAGQPREARGAHAAASLHTESYWLATIDLGSWTSGQWPPNEMSRSASLSEAIKTTAWIDLGLALGMTARVMVRSHAALFERVRAEGGEACMLISLSPGALSGFNLSSGVCQIFGHLGVSLEFETAED